MNIDFILNNENEKPLDNLVSDGGFCGIFRTIGCVGDSLSSGEFEGTNDKGENTYHDMFDYSWGQFLARISGSKALNFSRGGMTAKEYCQSFAEANGFWDKSLACQAYIIALGVNDVCQCSEKYPMGSADDIDLNDWKNNKPSFAGYYGQIVQRLKEIEPRAKFFFINVPNDSSKKGHSEAYDKHATLLNDISKIFSNSYVLDFRKYAPDYSGEFKKKLFLGGHMTPCGYVLTAQMVVSYIDYIIRHNMSDFKQVAFIGTPYKNTKE